MRKPALGLAANVVRKRQEKNTIQMKNKNMIQMKTTFINLKKLIVFTFCIVIFFTNVKSADVPGGKVYKVTIKDSLFKFSYANYSIFIPDSISVIQGIFIHQHGCTMEGTGYQVAYDIKYQEFAKKWHLAIIGPDIYPKLGGDCFQWVDSESSGSSSALFTALDSFSQSTGHAEIKTAPWLLWGHSGGGYWALSMLKTYPERILAIVINIQMIISTIGF